MIQTILVNGSIRTLDDSRPMVSALAISYGRVVALGSDESIRMLATSHTAEINLGGRTVLPGLTDAHLHWEAQARSLSAVDVFEVPSKAIALERVKQRADASAAGEWITGHGWAQDLWEDRAFPTKNDLDEVAPDNPVILKAKSGHASWVNSRALQLAGITQSTSDPEGGQILRAANGEATGILLETASKIVQDKMPNPTSEELADLMTAAQEPALKCGITMIHDFDEPSCLAALQILRERGALGLRVVKQINQKWLDAAIASGIRTNFGDDWIRIGALKLFADGALGPKTALMFEPYAGEPDNYGMTVVDKEEMIEYASRGEQIRFADQRARHRRQGGTRCAGCIRKRARRRSGAPRYTCKPPASHRTRANNSSARYRSSGATGCHRVHAADPCLVGHGHSGPLLGASAPSMPIIPGSNWIKALASLSARMRRWNR